MHKYYQAQKGEKAYVEMAKLQTDYMLSIKPFSKKKNFRQMDVPVPLIPSRGFDRISHLDAYPENHRTT